MRVGEKDEDDDDHSIAVFFLSTIRYDTRCYFNVRSTKADVSRLNLPHAVVIYCLLKFFNSRH